eukprot:Amastigsp_a176418_32.p3 type:complete len:101 gc:universal Amastigsp_a176418_32:1530-1228(-)
MASAVARFAGTATTHSPSSARSLCAKTNPDISTRAATSRQASGSVSPRAAAPQSRTRFVTRFKGRPFLSNARRGWQAMPSMTRTKSKSSTLAGSTRAVRA